MTSSAAPGPPPGRSLLPPLEGLSVVDLGCGRGDFVRWAHGEGAASVLGLDLSTDALERARRLGEPEGTRFEQADLEQLRLTFASYDLAWCDRVAHRVRDPLRLTRTVGAGLRPDGVLAAVVPAGAADALVEAVRGARLVVDAVHDLSAAPGTGEPSAVVLAHKPAPGPWPRASRTGPPPGLA